MIVNSVGKHQKEIEELKEFVECTMKEIYSISHVLNWEPKTFENVEEFCECPYDSSHRMPKEALDKHLVSCQWKAEGYQASDIPLSESSGVRNSSSIKFDEQLQAQVLQSSTKMEPALSIGLAERLIPRTSDRILTDFTSNERRLLYEYVIANTVKPDIGQDIADSHANQKEQRSDKELSYLELLAQERNLKRRRAKHKGVHTNKKSHTEILREVISQQMEMYMEQITDDVQDTSALEPLEQIPAATCIEPAERREQYSPRRRENPTNSYRTSFGKNTYEEQGSSRKTETYNQTMSRHGVRPQDQQKSEKYSLQEKSDRKDSSRRHSHHEHKKKSRSEYHDTPEDTHRSRHKSHKKKSHSSRKREGSYDQYYSHHSRDKRHKREKEKNRD